MKAHCCPADVDDVSETYLHDRLPPVAKGLFERHFITCARCWARLQFSREIVSGARRAVECLRPHTRVVTAGHFVRTPIQVTVPRTHPVDPKAAIAGHALAIRKLRARLNHAVVAMKVPNSELVTAA